MIIAVYLIYLSHTFKKLYFHITQSSVNFEVPTLLYDFNCRGVKSSTVSLTMATMAGSFAFDGEWATAEVASTHPHGGPMVHDTRIIDGVTFSSLSVQVSGCVIYLWLSDRPNLGESIHHDNGTIPCADLELRQNPYICDRPTPFGFGLPL